DEADLVYRTEAAKFGAVVDDIAERHEKGQPVLVGTTSVDKSEYLSQELKKRGIRHEVLNAKHHEREAAIVADAGRKGAVTVATNMAGRGTDIMLGGNPEFRAVAELKKRGLDPEETPEEYEAAWDDALAAAEQAVETEHDEVTEAGGLYVLGTERHESRRIDNQLRGRSGRQGDPGESRFYLSLEDNLMRLFNAGFVDRVMTTAKIDDETPIAGRMLTKSIEGAQSQLEGQNYETRKNVLKYDDVLNRQRTVVYDERRRVLKGEDLEEQVRHFMTDVVGGYVDAETASGFSEDWDLDRLFTAIRAIYPVTLSKDDLVDSAGGLTQLTAPNLREEIVTDIHEAYDRREGELGEPVARELERRVVLSVLDRKWREHLYEMDYLKEGIGLRSMAQRDPLVEYQREGFQLFEAMNDAIKEESVGYLFNSEVEVPTVPESTSEPKSVDALLGGGGNQERPTISAKGLEDGSRSRHLHYSSPSEDGGVQESDERNGASSTAGTSRAERRAAAKKAKKAAKKQG
ncbi:MAG: preprotein translocase subunit SecA, partial [Janibacter sp.]